MKDLNKKSDFDRMWEEAFKEAEMTPSEGLWDKIDSAISKEEAGYFKKKAFLFKMLAAASIVFALGVGLFSINYYINQNNQPLVVQENSIGEDSSIGLEDPISTLQQEDIENQVNSTEVQSEKLEKNNLKNTGPMEVSENEGEAIDSNSKGNIVLIQQNDLFQLNSVESGETRALLTFKDILGCGINPNTDNVIIYPLDHIYSIPFIPKGASKKKNEVESGVFLAGLDFSTGVFDPNFQQGENTFASSGYYAQADAKVESLNDQLASFNTSSKDFLLVRSAGKENEPDITFSYGANVGFKVSKRIVLQTGVAYRKANSTTTTTGYVEEIWSDTKIPIVASHQYQINGLSSVNRIPETELSNQYEFASIPVRAGYVFLDKKINLTLMAGISTEFFLNNKIVDRSEFLETLSSTSGVDSPYKNVYFNGTLGTMVGYTFAKNYLLMVEPSYRFAVNSFTKDDFYLNSYPSSFMVSFGVAYNFK